MSSNGLESSHADDELLGEVDVLLSQPDKNSELHLLQYPLRTVAVPVGTERAVEGVSLRPRHGRVELRLAVIPSIKPTGDEENGDVEQPREPCPVSFDAFQDRADEKPIGDTQLLRSQTSAPRPHANYAAASFSSGTSDFPAALTIVPLRSIAQLRPAFDYLDAREVALAKARADDKALRAAARSGNAPIAQGNEEEVAPLEVSFRRRESERAAERRRNSHASLTRREMEEPWLPLKYAAGTRDTKSSREQVFGGAAAMAVARKEGLRKRKEEEAVLVTDSTYMDLFQAHTRSVKVGVVAKGRPDQNEPLSLRKLQRLPTNVAVSQAITHARIMRFDDLLRVVPATVSPEDVLSATRVVAVVLRGCWVAKNSTHSSAAKVKRGSERYDASRVLVLNLFRSSRVVKCAAAIEAIGTPPSLNQEHVEMILGEVADRESGKGWVFRLPDDLEFEEKCPELIEAQNSDWDRRVAMAQNLILSKRKR